MESSKSQHTDSAFVARKQRLKSDRETLNVLVSGGTGLIGSALIKALLAEGHIPKRLGRNSSTSEIVWDPASKSINSERMIGFDAVVHLAGENIASRWNSGVKRRIRDSRVNGTRLLAETLASLEVRPRVLVCASAIGLYGDRGDEILNEQSLPGESFLAGVCKEWEAAAEVADRAGIRVVHARFGIVLTPDGGALKSMLTPFKLCAGGIVGSGKQYWSWIAIDDAVNALIYCINNPSLRGPVNVVSPRPVTNYEFTKTLGRVLHRPTIFPMPAFAARTVLGEMADALLLSSARVIPERLEANGFAFRYPDLQATLEQML